MRIIECVPNFSEGRDPAVIEAIAAAARSAPGAQVLDVDPGAATNRTVYTIAGEPEAVLEAAFRAIAKGAELIDMSRHKGAHARQGACDVCPFVPISGVTMDECVALAARLGERVGRELGIPVYLYAEAARRPERKRLPDIRAGEYEALEAKLKKKEWKPDFGPSTFNAKSGATTIGARNFLVAYNVNLNGTNVKLAKKIALEIREKGKAKRDAKGAVVKNAQGETEMVPGLFRSVQAAGWIIPEYQRAQVTINILDIDAAPLHAVYDACVDLASRLGGRVTGSEIVGMVPKRVLVEAGRYFLKKQGQSAGVSETELIRSAVLSLGLSDAAPFDPAKKVIEERFKPASPLASASVRGFIDELASDSPAPGGGSAAALAGALAAGLVSMVAALTHGKKGFEGVQEEMEALGARAQELKAELTAAVDADTAAFNKVMEAMRMPKASKEEAASRQAAVEAANKEAALVPLSVLDAAGPVLELALAVSAKGNPNSVSDAGAAAALARACAVAAHMNVAINLAAIKDGRWRAKVKKKAAALLSSAKKRAEKVEKLVNAKISRG